MNRRRLSADRQGTVHRHAAVASEPGQDGQAPSTAPGRPGLDRRADRAVPPPGLTPFPRRCHEPARRVDTPPAEPTVRRRGPFPFLVLAALAGAADGVAQTVPLPAPAPSSLDRIAQNPTFGAPLAPPPSSWDPYAPQAGQWMPAAPATGMSAPSALGGQPGYPGWQPGAPSLVPTQGTGNTPASLFPQGMSTQNPTMQQTMRLYQGVRGSWAYIFGDGNGTSVGINEFDTTATFALPFFYHSQANLNHAPLLVTPGFGLQLWNGPET
ncbi:MAG: hypothetical protein FJ275_13750, partial [Planctomycetes bacterium]|nr:hypothetical protein [Planctomycetota bacterium]